VTKSKALGRSRGALGDRGPYFTIKAHGTGLGLFVSRQHLEDFAGTLGFVSEAREGSTFVEHLPLERGAVPSPAGKSSHQLIGVGPD
jgi:hypothetical protein